MIDAIQQRTESNCDSDTGILQMTLTQEGDETSSTSQLPFMFRSTTRTVSSIFLKVTPNVARFLLSSSQIIDYCFAGSLSYSHAFIRFSTSSQGNCKTVQLVGTCLREAKAVSAISPSASIFPSPLAPGCLFFVVAELGGCNRAIEYVRGITGVLCPSRRKC